MGVGRTKCTWPLWHHSVGRSRPGWTLRPEGGQGGGGRQGGGGQSVHGRADCYCNIVNKFIFMLNLVNLLCGEHVLKHLHNNSLVDLKLRSDKYECYLESESNCKQVHMSYI